MASDIWLRTIQIARQETCCHYMGSSFRLTARFLLYAPYHRQDSTYHSICYISHGALAGTRNSSMRPPYEGSIRRPIAPRVFAHGAMGHRIDPSWGGPIELFLVPASAPRLVYKGCGMCYPVCGMVHIKEPLLLIDKSSLCGGSGFPFSLSEWSLTICLMPYNCR